MVRVLLFAGLAQQAGTQELSLVVNDPVTIKEIKKRLQEKIGKLNGLDHCLTAINEEYADDSSTVDAGDTLAFIPPVSGG
ncbi:molybdopterin converting factor subunit 1 [Bacillus sp. NEB1478]|uniref:molybdopterin converting factor subunit 1 n=1 Tax=Bacillus sp. NEB1478 TaxID=3073816 RepID=UPI002873D5C5|nr:molybdopterin converting factor subunit 1 [Bacillus sp. NEB1478]WNB90627.1 molybdopterin converting factor subunit 1 [Bacillus sp. NEB1478]